MKTYMIYTSQLQLQKSEVHEKNRKKYKGKLLNKSIVKVTEKKKQNSGSRWAERKQELLLHEYEVTNHTR